MRAVDRELLGPFEPHTAALERANQILLATYFAGGLSVVSACVLVPIAVASRFEVSALQVALVSAITLVGGLGVVRGVATIVARSTRRWLTTYCVRHQLEFAEMVVAVHKLRHVWFFADALLSAQAPAKPER